MKKSLRSFLGEYIPTWWLYIFKKKYYIPNRFCNWIRYIPTWRRNKTLLLNDAKKHRQSINYTKQFPVYVTYNGSYLPNRHYWLQDIWALRKLLNSIKYGCLLLHLIK